MDCPTYRVCIDRDGMFVYSPVHSLESVCFYVRREDSYPSIPSSGRTDPHFFSSRDEGLDGIDLDFEGIRSHEEWNAYQSFLYTASAILHRHDLTITVALHPGQHLPKTICTSLDRVHVMTYDIIRQRDDNGRYDHHASMRSTIDAMEGFVRAGCPPHKLVMGIPAYGRHERDPGLVRTYSEIVDDVLMKVDDDDGEDDDDMETRMNGIRSIDSWNGYRFDSPDDVRAKVEYVVRNGYGGIFIWELGQDRRVSGLAEGGMLLEAAAAVNYNVGDVSWDEL